MHRNTRGCPTPSQHWRAAGPRGKSHNQESAASASRRRSETCVCVAGRRSRCLHGNHRAVGPARPPAQERERLQLPVPQAAVCACARHRPRGQRGPDGGRCDAPLPWQPSPGCVGSRCRGLPRLLVRAKKEEERRAPPAISVTSAAAPHRQEGL